MNELLKQLPNDEQEKIHKRKPPDWVGPMLATLTDKRFSDAEWIFERKLDGERCLAFSKRGKIRLLSRNRKELNDTYPEVVDALENKADQDYVVDGEIVAFSGNGTSFSRLQQRMQIKDREEAKRTNVKVYYYLFDLMYLHGYNLTDLPLRTRKNLLQRSVNFSDPVRFTAHRNEGGESFYKEACKKGWEGVIAKRADSPYVHSRSRNWLKFKCSRRREFVIGGFTDPQGSRVGFGALLLGYYEGDDFKYAGQVGTGFDDDLLRRLGDRLKSLERKTSPFDEDGIKGKGAHFVTPKLVGEVGFTEWTDDGKLRHPRFVGLRRDKKPREVKREEPS